jgi:hypothetical protein
VRPSGDRLRADYVRTSLGTDRRVGEVIAGRRGFITGNDANNQPAGDKAMTSDRWAAITREQRAAQPAPLRATAAARPGRATVLTSRRRRGRMHRVLLVRGDVAPVRRRRSSRARSPAAR